MVELFDPIHQGFIAGDEDIAPDTPLSADAISTQARFSRLTNPENAPPGWSEPAIAARGNARQNVDLDRMIGQQIVTTSNAARVAAMKNQSAGDSEFLQSSGRFEFGRPGNQGGHSVAAWQQTSKIRGTTINGCLIHKRSHTCMLLSRIGAGRALYVPTCLPPFPSFLGAIDETEACKTSPSHVIDADKRRQADEAREAEMRSGPAFAAGRAIGKNEQARAPGTARELFDWIIAEVADPGLMPKKAMQVADDIALGVIDRLDVANVLYNIGKRRKLWIEAGRPADWYKGGPFSAGALFNANMKWIYKNKGLDYKLVRRPKTGIYDADISRADEEGEKVPY